jgi:hypothetical protein
MSRQRSLQNGRKGAASDHSVWRLQVGHFTRTALDLATGSGAAD